MSLIPKLPPLIKTVSHETLSKTESRLLHFPNDTDTAAGMLRIFLAWTAYFFGSITLKDLGVTLAIVFTLLQIIALLRREFGLFKSKEPK